MERDGTQLSSVDETCGADAPAIANAVIPIVAIVHVPANMRDRVGDFLDDAQVRDPNGRWIDIDATKRGLLGKFIKGDYLTAPSKSWLAIRGLRIGHDNAGVYLHYDHVKRYVGLPAIRLRELDGRFVSGSPSPPGVGSQPPARMSCAKRSDAPVSKDYVRRRDAIIRSIFKVADVDGNGAMSWMELGLFLRRAAPRLSKAEVDSIFHGIDMDCSGDIDAHEFETWMRESAPAVLGEEISVMASTAGAEIHALFRLMDSDGSGGITKPELTSVLQKACHMTAQDVEDIFASIDADENGFIDYDEFIHFLYPVNNVEGYCSVERARPK